MTRRVQTEEQKQRAHAKQKEWRQKNHARMMARRKEWRQLNLEIFHEREKQKNRARKEKVVAAYGGKCSCCGETHVEFLTIDHIHGGGRKHRSELSKAGTTMYQWLINHKFPDGFRLLCSNCNLAFGLYGKCPHGNLIQEVTVQRPEDRQLRLVS